MDNFSPAQYDRFEAYRRHALPKQAVRKVYTILSFPTQLHLIHQSSRWSNSPWVNKFRNP